ncbi:MAG: flagellar basal body P-ring formation protein FlgA [Deltaproteobacteria bacterium]|nr:flagellar basal body P-ring formation protein FlgA [Deltaproteobacteria bacterium]
MKIFTVNFSVALLISVAVILVMAPMGERIHAYESRTFQGTEIRSLVRDHIEKHMPWPKGTIRMEFSGRVDDLTLTGEKITYMVQGGPRDDYIGSASYAVKFLDEGCLIREIVVRVNIEVLRNFVVAVRPLGRNWKIEREDLDVVQRWVSRIPPNAIADPEEATGMRLSMSIGTHRELTRNMLRRVPAVKKGKMVRVMLDDGPLNIQTIGLSEQDGAIGEVIRVRNVSSKKAIYARVVEPSVVQVIF